MELKPYPFETILLEPPNRIAAFIERAILSIQSSLTARAALLRRKAS